MYPGFMQLIPLPQTRLSMRQLGEFLVYLKRHDVTELFWNVAKFRVPEGNFSLAQPLAFKPGIHFQLGLSARQKDLIVVCRVPLPTVIVAADVIKTQAEAERLVESFKQAGFNVLEGELQSFVPSIPADDDIWEVEEMLKANLDEPPPFPFPKLQPDSDK